MIRTFILFLCTLFTDQIPAQNLLINGDFEQRLSCHEFNAPCALLGWKNVYLLEELFDYFPTINEDNHQNVCRIVAFDTKRQIKTYIQTQLLCPLIPNNTYILEFDLKFNHTNFLDIGFFFTNNYLYSTDPANLMTTPTLVINHHIEKRKRKKDNLKWQKVKIPFSVKDTVSHLVIGNFEDLKIFPKKDFQYNALFDNFSLSSEKSMTCDKKEDNLQLLKMDTRRHSIVKKTRTKILILPKLLKTSSALLEIPIPQIQRIHFSDTLIIQFENDKAALNDTTQINNFVRYYKPIWQPLIVINGHANSLGEEKYNKTLSEKRATNIAKFLTDNYTYPISINFYGETNPLKSNSNNYLDKNRRAEIIVHYIKFNID